VTRRARKAAAAEPALVALFCAAAAAHVLLYSAAAPFFGNVDEQIHLDLAIKYAQGRVPRAFEPFSEETLPYAATYGTYEYLWPSEDFPGQGLPPPWRLPGAVAARIVSRRETEWRTVVNHESSEPPLYYAAAAAWWRAGKALGLQGLTLLYWLRFLNAIFCAALAWAGYRAARLVFPDRALLRLGVPAALAAIPQSAFYSVSNDALAPLTFGAAFLLLLEWLAAEAPGVGLGAAAGLGLAAAFLTKLSSLPQLAVCAAAVLLELRAPRRRASGAALIAAAGAPMLAWALWCRRAFGDFAGSAGKIAILGWTRKPFGEWWSHPLFTPLGLKHFLGRLIATFWQGELLWHRRPLAWRGADALYVAATLGLMGWAAADLLSRSPDATARQRRILWLSSATFGAAVAFQAFLSLIYDFHDCFYPSRALPYFTSGRLMLGALIPFLLFLLYGLDRALKRVTDDRARALALGAAIVVMLVTEAAIDWPLFSNPYNWFHM